MQKNKKIIIVGGGPGGLASAMLLAYRGLDVSVYEKEKQVGGRSSSLILDKYKFDLGSTLLMMKFVFDAIFQNVGRDINENLEFNKIDPMYRLFFKDKYIDFSSNQNTMLKNLADFKSNRLTCYNLFLKKEKERLIKAMTILQNDFSSIADFFKKDFLLSIPAFSPGKSLFSVMNKYFRDPDLSLGFSFQSAYLGMSPFKCPGMFSIIPFVEHAFGIYYVKGGLNNIWPQMVNIIKQDGGKIITDTEVQKILINNKKFEGVKLFNGTETKGDYLILNSDFGYSAQKLFPENYLKKYSNKKINRKRYSCSTFMIYLGLKKLYNFPHHNIVFGKDFSENMKSIFKKSLLPKNGSVYICNPSVSDDSVAPAGHSSVMILALVPNNKAGIDWDQQKVFFADSIINLIEKRLQLSDIKKNIVVKKIITPDDWENEHNIHQGAVFNLSHNLRQLLIFRPHNQFEELENCYLAGGGTHPGSGLPIILESARIAVNMILEKEGLKKFTAPSLPF